MHIIGNLSKMHTQATTPVSYSLVLNDTPILLNPLLGHALSLEFTGQINCIYCGRKTSKSFNQGYCYPCFTRLAQCDTCIVKPELCHYAQGTCREPEWGEQHCMQPHYVYLANSSGIKVGITRHTQLPTRWIDQGATQALPILKVPTRHQSGLIENTLAQHISDKTQWQKMLKAEADKADLRTKRDELITLTQSDINDLALTELEYLDDPLTELTYPIDTYPTKVTAHNFDKTAQISGILQGIKGQYLLLSTGVLNIRKFGGYQVKFSSEI
ncbi:DUF2797 domain-containing protein [Thiofilum flexile]|uniref:DUF2797 domain-containing protein n=1 Tax=Thiofilum flexile TaxID=125627 RepID=UPI00059298BA